MSNVVTSSVNYVQVLPTAEQQRISQLEYQIQLLQQQVQWLQGQINAMRPMPQPNWGGTQPWGGAPPVALPNTPLNPPYVTTWTQAPPPAPPSYIKSYVSTVAPHVGVSNTVAFQSWNTKIPETFGQFTTRDVVLEKSTLPSWTTMSYPENFSTPGYN
jgi:hypothetical protein